LKPEIKEFLLTNYPLIIGVSFSSPYVIGLGSTFDEELGRMGSKRLYIRY